MRSKQKLTVMSLVIVFAFLVSVWLVIQAQVNQPDFTLEGNGQILSASYSPDGKILAVSGGEGCLVTLWDVEKGVKIREFDLCEDDRQYKQGAGMIAYSPDGHDLLVGGYYDNFSQILNAETGEPVSILIGHEDYVNSVAWNFDGTLVITTSADGAFKIWDARSGRELIGHIGESSAITCTAFDPTGNRVVTGNYGGNVEVWNSSTGEKILSLIGHTDRVGSCNFHPDGTRIITSSFDKSVREWSAVDGTELRRFDYDGWLVSASYSFDGEAILSGIWFYDDIMLLDEATGDIIDRFEHSEPQHGHLSFVTFSPSGSYFASGAGNTIKFWNYLNR